MTATCDRCLREEQECQLMRGFPVCVDYPSCAEALWRRETAALYSEDEVEKERQRGLLLKRHQGVIDLELGPGYEYGMTDYGVDLSHTPATNMMGGVIREPGGAIPFTSFSETVESAVQKAREGLLKWLDGRKKVVWREQPNLFESKHGFLVYLRVFGYHEWPTKG